MQCIVCKDESKEAKYKCPKCNSPYCSVVCFKEHKTNCVSATESALAPPADIEPQVLTGDPQFVKILSNERVQELLAYEGVKKHLKLLNRILHDTKLSGEMNAEGRRMVALKKLRELRKGGREANEAIEELVVTVTSQYDDEHEKI